MKYNFEFNVELQNPWQKYAKNIDLSKQIILFYNITVIRNIY